MGPPHSPELNGVVERTNRTLGEKVQCLLTSSRTPKMFWVDALCHIMFSLNSVPCHTPAGFTSPNQANNSPSVDPCYLRPFGCLVWYKVPEANRKKLDTKGRASILLSYINHGAGYQLWDLWKHCVVKSRDVIFAEDVFPYADSLAPTVPVPVPVEIEWSPSTSGTALSHHSAAAPPPPSSTPPAVPHPPMPPSRLDACSG